MRARLLFTPRQAIIRSDRVADSRDRGQKTRALAEKRVRIADSPTQRNDVTDEVSDACSSQLPTREMHTYMYTLRASVKTNISLERARPFNK